MYKTIKQLKGDADKIIFRGAVKKGKLGLFVEDFIDHAVAIERKRITDIIEQTIQEERFMGAPRALNEAKKAIEREVKDKV